MNLNPIKPTVLVIFGGAGDLAWRKLIPSLYCLYENEKLPSHFAILIVDGKKISESALQKNLHKGVNLFPKKRNISAQSWKNFSKMISYIQGNFKQKQTYKKIRELSEKLKLQWGHANLIFYMATSPSFFGEIPKFLHEAGLTQNMECERIVVEKPIGHDIESARQLNKILNMYFDESQIFRIDHYLGKETVQNILAFRFANPLFEPLWNSKFIEYITITAAETVGIEHRGAYYEHAGALRDMVQNHLLQLLCLVGMEPMLSFDANEIRNKKVDLLHAVRKITPDAVHDSVVRGQYSKGTIGGKKVKGYREEEGVSPTSQTETFVALRLFIDNWRWQGIPFYLRTGKRLAQHASEICIHFRTIPHQSFPPEATLDWQPARLVISIQPEPGIVIRFQAKYPGPKMHLREADMVFNYQKEFQIRIPEAYETLLEDILTNDQTLFMRSDQAETSWELLMPIIKLWREAPPNDFPNYSPETWGPERANGLLAQAGHSWPLPINLK